MGSESLGPKCRVWEFHAVQMFGELRLGSKHLAVELLKRFCNARVVQLFGCVGYRKFRLV